jgi:leucyl-tRNA synthetase
LAEDNVKVLPVQIDGKRRGEIRAPAGATKDEVWELISADSEIGPKLQGVRVVRFIHVPDRIANLVTEPA